MKFHYLLVVLHGALFFKGCSLYNLNTNIFPDNFMFGVATSAYQIEGAWNTSGKGENIWDHLTHKYPNLITDRSNGDISCDSYNRIKEDVVLLKELGVDFYRFSLSWSRILPNGFAHQVNSKAIRYYNHLIDTLLENGIQPMVTLYHWDLPEILQSLGGWANVLMVDYFTDYAQVAFDHFGEKVKFWISFNQPELICSGYGSSNYAPVNVSSDGIGDYLCGYTVLLAHASAYRLYNETYRFTQEGLFGIALSSKWYEPSTTSTEDVLAAYRMLQFKTGWFGHPIFKGDYPDIMKAAIAERSIEEGFPYSRLPELTALEVERVKGTADFLAFNFFTSEMAASKGIPPARDPSYASDYNARLWQDPHWEPTVANWFKVTPWGLRNILVWLKDEYNNPPIYLTGNGYPDLGSLRDDLRVNYLKLHLSSVLDAIEAGVNVRAYTVWSLLDSFEWLDGYSIKYGLYYVDMSHPKKKRAAKASAEFYKDIIANRRIAPQCQFKATPENNSGATISISSLLFISFLILITLTHI